MRRMMSLIRVFVGMIVLLSTNAVAGQRIDSSLNFVWKQVYSDEILGITWSPDSQHIAFGDTEQRYLYIFDVQIETVERKFSLPPTITKFSGIEVSWSPNGSFLALAMNGRAYVMDAQTGDIIMTYSNTSDTEPRQYEIRDVRWSHDSLSIAAFSILGYIHIFDVRSGITLTTIDFHGDGIAFPFNSFDWSSESSLLAAATYSDYIGIWDSNGHPAIEQNMQNRDHCPGLNPKNVAETLGLIVSLKWSNDSQKLAVGSEIGLWVCSIGKDKTISYTGLDRGGNYSTVWSPDDHWLVSTSISPVDELSNKCDLKVYDVTRGYNVQIITGQHCPATLAWSPDGQYLAARNDGHLWVGTVMHS